DLAGEAVARRYRSGAAVRRGLGAGTAEARLSPLRVFRFHLFDDRRRMGIHRRDRHPRPVRHVRVARLPHRALGGRSVRPAARRRAHRADRRHRGAAHRREPGALARDGNHAAVHLERTVELLLVGARRGIEAELLPRQPFRHRLLPIEPIYRRAWWRNARWLWLAPRVWRDVGRLLTEERPAIVIGTGGYAAGPIVLRAQRAGIPTALVEENAFPGLTT